MLEFEHIIQVNDLSDSDAFVIGRTQLWEGLVLRARCPDKFNSSLSCRVEDLAADEFERTINVGDSSFCERVTFIPGECIHTQTTEEIAQMYAESLTRLEEPQTGYLFVRFSYKRDLDNSDDAVDIGEHLKAAYVQTDQDAITMIRSLAQSGLFGQSVN